MDRSVPPPPLPTVTLLTDFGTRDGYVAAMKGVMADLVPGVRLDDASHDLEQGDIRGASWALSRYWNRYPPGTVHLAVVDPGVGTDRRALAVEADGRFVVAPDNGLPTRVLAAAGEWRAVETTDERYWGGDRSRTFHGRDLFAPVAAHLARGVELEALGPGISDPVRLEDADPIRTREGIVGEVVAEDHFGNLITNIPASVLSGGRFGTVVVGGTTARKTESTDRGAGSFGGLEESKVELALAPTYGSVESGELTVLINSAGMLEVAVRNGSAARRLGAGRGLPVEVRLGGGAPGADESGDGEPADDRP